MQARDTQITDELQEIVGLQTELKMQEDRYTSLLKADEPLEKLKEIRLKIKYLKTSLNKKEKQATTLFA